MPTPSMDYASIATPLILGTASVIAFVSVRSTSIADRIRGADREIILADTTVARRKNLLLQVHGLKRRYTASTYALLLLLFAFAAFVIMGALNATLHHGAIAAFGIGAVLGVVGFGLTLYEVMTSGRTLFADTEYAELVATLLADKTS